MWRIAGMVAVVGACSFTGLDPAVIDAPPGTTIDAVPGADAAPTADAAPLGPWGAPTVIAELNTTSGEDDPSMTGDQLEIYFGSDRQGTPEDVWKSTRPTATDPWTTPVRVAELSSTVIDSNIKVSSDGLTIFIASTRLSIDSDLFVATRIDRSAPWTTPTRIDELCSTAGDYCASASPELLRVVFCSSRNGDEDIYQSERATTGAPWGTPVEITELNSTDHDCDPMEPDDRRIYFSSLRPGTGDSDIYVASRVGAGYGAPAEIGPVNTTARDRDPWVSADGHVMLFSSDRLGSDDLYISVR